MASPLISVIIPARNEKGKLRATISSIVAGKSPAHSIEIVIVDDASSDGGCDRLESSVPADVPLRVVRQRTRAGVGRSRNRGAQEARGDILFMTDSHMRFPANWTDMVVANARPNRILAATITDPAHDWKGYGCRLVVPYMGTWWNNRSPGKLKPVQIASSAGTVVPRDLFHRMGGYDSGMMIYGACEPEFSLRAWLSGAEIVSVPKLELQHSFKARPDAHEFLKRYRSFIVHNNVRFGLIYLNKAASLQMLRHYAMKFPRHMQKAMRLVEAGGVWERRAALQKSLTHDFSWFVAKFGLKDQVGLPIL